MPFEVRLSSFALLVLVICSSGCVARRDAFLHSFREQFSITDEEIKDTQFYLSAEILAQTASAGGSGPMTESIVVPAETPGVVVAVGPKWIRVNFKEGHSGVHFCANPAGGRDAYYLASEVPGKEGLQILQDEKEKFLIHEGRRFAVNYGTSATLLANVGDLKALKEKRMTVPGRKK